VIRSSAFAPSPLELAAELRDTLVTDTCRRVARAPTFVGHQGAGAVQAHLL
jgi:hypothetical protein